MIAFISAFLLTILALLLFTFITVTDIAYDVHAIRQQTVTTTTVVLHR